MSQLILSLSLSLAALFGQWTIGSRSFSPTASSAIIPVEYVCVSSAVSPAPCIGVSSGATSFTANFGTSTTANETIIATTWSGPTGSAYGMVTDSASESYTQDATVRVASVSTHYGATIFYLCHSAAGVTSFTWTFGSGDLATYSWLAVTHIKGLSSSCADVAANFGSAQGTPFTSTASGTTNYPNEFLVGPVHYAGPSTYTPSGAWGIGIQGTDNNNYSHAMFTQVVSSTGSYAAAGSGTGSSSAYYPAIRTVH